MFLPPYVVYSPQKCRVQLRVSRIGSFDVQRGPLSAATLTDDDRMLIGSAIQSELRELNADLALQDQIAGEQSDEAFAEYLLEIGQKEADFIGQLLDDDQQEGPFFCPICQTDVLQPVFDHNRCERCALRFKSPGDPRNLQYEVLRKMVEHEQRAPGGCAAPVTFFAEPLPGQTQFSALNMFCDACDFYATFGTE